MLCSMPPIFGQMCKMCQLRSTCWNLTWKSRIFQFFTLISPFFPICMLSFFCWLLISLPFEVKKTGILCSRATPTHPNSASLQGQTLLLSRYWWCWSATKFCILNFITSPLFVGGPPRVRSRALARARCRPGSSLCPSCFRNYIPNCRVLKFSTGLPHRAISWATIRKVEGG